MASRKKTSRTRRGSAVRGRKVGKRAGRPPAARRTLDARRDALALEPINHSVYDWQSLEHKIYHSPQLRAVFGRRDDQTLTPEESTDRIHSDDLPAYRKALIAHLKGDSPRFVSEYRYLNNQGDWRWARQSGIAQRNAEGIAYRMIGATVDITDEMRRELELAAARSEVETTREHMRTVLENMSDGIVLIDRDFNWIFGNEQFNKFLQVPPEITQPGTSCYDVIRYQALRGDFGTTDDIEKVVRSRADMMRTPGGFRYERQTRSGLYIEFT